MLKSSLSSMIGNNLEAGGAICEVEGSVAGKRPRPKDAVFTNNAKGLALQGTDHDLWTSSDPATKYPPPVSGPEYYPEILVMARAKSHIVHGVQIYEDEEQAVEMDESRDPLEESGGTRDDSDQEELDESVAEDIANFERSFKDITKRFRLINRIGEGELSIFILLDSYDDQLT